MIDEALPVTEDAEFNLPSSARHSLSSLLIVHPIAAFCNLIVLGLAIAAHFHSPSHSARYLLGLLILLLPTLLVTLLAFLVDILLFVPHLQWGGWIVLASTILITASGVVTCAMRRTLVSRKARKKRIAENAEMSGENFYARQAEESRMVMPPGSTESKMPMVNGAPGADNLPTFNTYSNVYSTRRSEERPIGGVTPIESMPATSPVEGGRYYSGQRSRSNSRPRHDEFGAPLGARSTIEDRPPMPMPMPMPMAPSNRGGYGPPRGRGNLAYRGRPYGAPRGRGGYPGGPHPGPPMPPNTMLNNSMNYRPPPPPGYLQRGPEGYDSAPPMDQNTSPTSPSIYSTDPRTAMTPVPAYGARAQSPAQGRQSPYGSRAQSPASSRAPTAMAPAMPPMPTNVPYGTDYHRAATGMDSDVLGMVEMQRVYPRRRSSQPPSPQEYV